jgi:hypothetical protein
MQSRPETIIQINGENIPLAASSENNDTVTNLKQFLSFLHYKLKVPAEVINEMIKQMSTVLNHYSPALNTLTLAKGWPAAQPKVVIPALYAGLAPMFAGLLNLLADKFNWKKLENARQSHQAVMAGMTAFMFILRTIIAAYVFVATDYGKEEEKVYSSDAVFFALAGISGVLGAGHTALNIFKAQSSAKNKVLEFLGWILNTINSASTIHSCISALDQNLNLGLKDSTDPTSQLVLYGVSLIGGGGVATAPERTNTFMRYLSGVTIANILFGINKALREEGKENDANLLLAAWVMMAVFVPVFTKAAMSGYQHYQRRQYEPIPDRELGTQKQLPTVEQAEVKISLGKFGLHAQSNNVNQDNQEEIKVLEETIENIMRYQNQ